jgi:hypothetical protein
MCGFVEFINPAEPDDLKSYCVVNRQVKIRLAKLEFHFNKTHQVCDISVALELHADVIPSEFFRIV